MPPPQLRHTAWCMPLWVNTTHTGPTLPLFRLLQSLGPSRGCCCWVHRLETLCSLSLGMLSQAASVGCASTSWHWYYTQLVQANLQACGYADIKPCGYADMLWSAKPAQAERCLHHALWLQRCLHHALWLHPNTLHSAQMLSDAGLTDGGASTYACCCRLQVTLSRV